MKISQAPAPTPTAVLVLADGTTVYGMGCGAVGTVVGEVCFNTAMSGYQEVLTDPSYAAQIVTFTFPHIGNVGVNVDDQENASTDSAIAARGAILRAEITSPSNYRAQMDLSAWMRRRGIVGISGVDTRALTASIRQNGMQTGVIAHNPAGAFDIETLAKLAKDWEGLEGRDLAKGVTTSAEFKNQQSDWLWPDGFGKNTDGAPHIVVIDFGVKQNILRRLSSVGCRVSVVPAQSSYETIMAKDPDGVVLSNGPGDPAATGAYAVPVIQQLIANKVPTFGICLGHQLMALAVGAKTKKMPQGHHGSNHPVKDLTTGKVEIVSMNHGFTVDGDTLPANVEETHTSLFDGTNAGIRVTDAPAFSVQYHPEASPGPQDSFYIFDRFLESTKAA